MRDSALENYISEWFGEGKSLTNILDKLKGAGGDNGIFRQYNESDFGWDVKDDIVRMAVLLAAAIYKLAPYPEEAVSELLATFDGNRDGINALFKGSLFANGGQDKLATEAYVDSAFTEGKDISASIIAAKRAEIGTKVTSPGYHSSAFGLGAAGVNDPYTVKKLVCVHENQGSGVTHYSVQSTEKNYNAADIDWSRCYTRNERASDYIRCVPLTNPGSGKLYELTLTVMEDPSAISDDNPAFVFDANGVDTGLTVGYVLSNHGEVSLAYYADAAKNRFNAAVGSASQTGGENTLAEGRGSHAEGYGTIATASYQFVHGKFNVPDGKSLEIVGNGKNSENRSNAYRLDGSGNAYYAGDVYIGTGEKLSDKAGYEYVDQQVDKFFVDKEYVFDSTKFKKRYWSPTEEDFKSDSHRIMTEIQYSEDATHIKITAPEWVSGDSGLDDKWRVKIDEFRPDGEYVGGHGAIIEGDVTSSVSVQIVPGNKYYATFGWWPNGISAIENDPGNVYTGKRVVDGETTYVANIAHFKCCITESRFTDTERKVDALSKLLKEYGTFDWSSMGSGAYELGWEEGYYENDEGKPVRSIAYIRSLSTSFYSPNNSVSQFVVQAPDGYAVAASEYDADGTFKGRIGSANTSDANATNRIVISPDPDRKYRFHVGKFSGGEAANKIHSTEFIDSIVLTEYSVVTDTDPTLSRPGFPAEATAFDSTIRKHLNILIYGNSYAADAWAYVPFILKAYGITVNIYLYYRGSGSIRRLVEEWTSDTVRGIDIYGNPHVRRMIHIDTRTMTAWSDASEDVVVSPKDMLSLCDEWDIITLQHTSSEEYYDADTDTWSQAPGLEPYCRHAIRLIEESYNKPYLLALFTTYNRCTPIVHDGDVVVPVVYVDGGGDAHNVLDNRVETLRADEALYNSEPFDFVIPVGAAVFNARTNETLRRKDIPDDIHELPHKYTNPEEYDGSELIAPGSSYGLSYVGDLFALDRTHLQEGVPCYIAALTVCEALFRKFYPFLTVANDTTRLTVDKIINQWKVQFRDGRALHTSDDITDNEKKYIDACYKLARKCAIAANNNPFDITPIYSTEFAPVRSNTPSDGPVPDDNEEIIYDPPKYWADSKISTPVLPDE